MGIRIEGPTLGRTLQTLSVPGITLTEAAFAAGSRFPWHAHRRASLCLVLEGTFIERFGRETYTLGRYDVAYKPGETVHANSCGASGARVLIVELEPRWLDQHEPRTNTSLPGTCITAAAAAELSGRLHGELVRQDTVTPLVVESICLELLVRVARAPMPSEHRTQPTWLKRAREILNARCSEHQSLTQIACEVGVHPVHLAQVFRRTYGLTIGEYTRRLRVHRGAQQLLTTPRTIVDIAMDCGFCDQSHFSRIFKLITSLTPAEYRRSAGRGAVLPALETMP